MEKAVASAPRTVAERPSRTWREKIAYSLGIGVWRADQQIAGYFFILPSLIGFSIFVLLPIVVSLVLSFHSWNLINPPQYVGTANYLELFTNDPIFGSVLKNTMWYSVLIVPIQLALGFVLALVMNAGLRAVRLYR